MKFHILSDLHIEFGKFQPPSVDADAVILAGDIAPGTESVEWAKSAFPAIPVFLVLGNHEYYNERPWDETLTKIREAAEGSNVRVLENDCAVIGNVRIIGATLWTDFNLEGNAPLSMVMAARAMSDYLQIKNERGFLLRPTDVLRKHEDSLDYIRSTLALPFEGKTVVVSHHAPTARSIAEKYKSRKSALNACYASELRSLFRNPGTAPDLYVHGHTHDSFDYLLEGTRLVCNPRGYAGLDKNPAFDSRKVVEI